jgi:hypothetical protein
VFIQFVVDLILDLVWVAQPYLRVEIHLSALNSLLLARDPDSPPQARTYRGCQVLEDLASDWDVLVREPGDQSGWRFVGDLRTGAIQKHEAS